MNLLILSKLLECINDNTVTEADLELLIKSKTASEIVEVSETPIDDIIVESVEVTVCSLSDNPKFIAKLGDENIISVSLCESVPNYCGTAKLTFMESTLFLNGCDQDGHTHINLDIEIGGEMMYNTPFIVKEDSTIENSIQLNRNILCNKQKVLSS